MHAVTLGVNHLSDLNNNTTMTATPPNQQNMAVDPLQLQQLVQLLGKSAMPKQTAVVECPKTMVGRVIGKGGETIKSLQQYTGAMIQIDQSSDPTRVTIAGSPQSLQLAVSMVNDIVRGTFKGFAMLRQIAMACASPGVNAYGQPQPIYVQGYGFVPPSQVFNPEDPTASLAGSGAGSVGSLMSPTGPLTPPITPMRAGAPNQLGGNMSADALAALLAGQQPAQGNLPGMPLPTQEALISQLLNQVAAQQQQQAAGSNYPSPRPESMQQQHPSGLDQASIQTMLAHAGLMGAGQVAAAQGATPGVAQSLGLTPGLPPSTSLMLSAQGTPAVLGQQQKQQQPQSPYNNFGGGGMQMQPQSNTSMSPLGSIGSPSPMPYGPGAAAFLGTSPSTASACSPVNGSGRTSPAPAITGLSAAANPLLSQPRPTSGDSSPLGGRRYGAIGTSVSSPTQQQYIGMAAEDALVARMGSITTGDEAVGGEMLPPGWKKVVDNQGLSYYFNTMTNESSFMPPVGTTMSSPARTASD